MNKTHHLLSICFLACSMAPAQESRTIPPRGAAGAPAGSAAAEAQIGIGKKEIRRGVVIARPGVFDPMTLRQIEEVARELAEVINAQAKLTRADAVRTAAPPAELQRMAAQMRELNDARRSMLNIVKMTPGSGEGSVPRCPEKLCYVGGCAVIRNICICLLCFPPLPSGAKVAAGPAGQPAADGADLLVIAAPAEASDAEIESLVQDGLGALRSMPESPRLVIETRSVPASTRQ